MPSIKYKDSDGSIVFIKCSISEDDEEEMIPEHKDSKAIDKLQKLIDALGNPSDVPAVTNSLIGGEGGPALPYSEIQLLKRIALDTQNLANFYSLLYNIEDKLSYLGTPYDPVANYDRLDDVDEYGSPVRISLISLAKGILTELHLLRTGVTT